MPPKQRGHNYVGKSKLFRHAIEDVHVGIGHAVIGRQAINLPTLPPQLKETGSLFHFSLGELSLGFVSRDYKAFRSEISGICPTHELLVHHRKKIASKLLIAMSKRSEALPAFLTLSMAFVRDLQVLFLPFIEAFFRAVNGLAVDANGKAIADAELLQRIYLAQASWLRDLHHHLMDPANCDTLDVVIRLYTTDMVSHAKGYVRRLSAEVLASTCRRAHQVLPLVFNTATQCLHDQLDTDAASPAANDEAEAADVEEEADEVVAAEQSKVDSEAAAAAYEIAADGLTQLVLECMRGIKGSVHAQFPSALAAVMRTCCIPPRKGFLEGDFAEPAALEWRGHVAPDPIALRRLGGSVLPGAVELLVGETLPQLHRTEQPALVIAVTAICDAVDPSCLEHIGMLRAVTAAKHNAVLRAAATSSAAESLQDLLRRAAKRVAEAITIGIKAGGKSSVRTAGRALEWASTLVLLLTDADEDEGEEDPEMDMLISKADRRSGAAALGSQLRVADALSRPLLEACCAALLAPGASAFGGPAVLRLFIQDIFEKDAALRAQRAAGGGLFATDYDGTFFFSRTFTAAHNVAVSHAAKLVGPAADPSSAAVEHFLMLLASGLRHADVSDIDRSEHPTVSAFADGSAASTAFKAIAKVLFSRRGLEFTDRLMSTVVVLKQLGIPQLVSAVAEQLNTLATALREAAKAGSSADSGALPLYLDVEGLLQGVQTKKKTGPSDTASEAVVEMLTGSLVADAPLFERESSWLAIRTGLGALQSAIAAGTLTKEKARSDARIERVLRASLMAPSQVVRLAAIAIHRDICQDDQLMEILEAIETAETADPLSATGNLDVKQQALTKVAFGATAGHISGHNAVIMTAALLGLLHLKFSALWPVVMAIVTSVVKHDLHNSQDRGVESDAKAPVWRGVVAPFMAAAVIGIDVSRRGGQRSEEGDDSLEAAQATTAETPYRVTLTDVQHHESGALIAHSGGVVATSHEGLLSASQIATTYLHDEERWTDSTSVIVAFLKGIIPAAGAMHDQLSPSPIVDIECAILSLAAIDRREHATIEQLRGLEERMALTMNLFCATALRRSKLPTARLGPLVDIGFAYLHNSHAGVQKASAELLRRLQVKPFDTHLPQLLPMCAPTKELFSFLGSFHVDTIDVNVRADYVAVAVLMAMPKLVRPPGTSGTSNSGALAKKIMHLLNGLSTAEELSGVVEMILSKLVAQHALRQSEDGAEIQSADPYDFIGAIAGSQRYSSGRQERLLKQLCAALRLVQHLEDAVGTKLSSWAARCFALAVNAYLVTLKQHHPFPNYLSTRTVSTLSTQLRGLASSQLWSLCDRFPAEVTSELMASASRSGALVSSTHTVLATMLEFSKTTVAAISAARNTAAKPVPVLRLIGVFVKHRDLWPLVGAYGDVVSDALALAFNVVKSSDGSSILQLPNDVVYGALQVVTDIVMQSSETFAPLPTGSSAKKSKKAVQEMSLQAAFLDQHLTRVFGCLHGLVTKLSVAPPRNTAGKSNKNTHNSGSLNLRMWREIIQTIAATSPYLDPKEAASQLSQVIEIALSFLRSPACAADHETADIAAEVLEALVSSAVDFDLDRHFSKFAGLFNAVTSPAARISMCRSLLAISGKVFPDQARSEQMAAVARVVRGLNSFEETEGEDAFTKYDYELRFHTFYSLLAHFKGEMQTGKQQPSKEADAVAAKRKRKESKRSTNDVPDGSVRTERQYVGDDDVSIPTDVPLAVEALQVIGANIMFFLREREASVRNLAGQTLSGLIRFGATSWVPTNVSAVSNDTADPEEEGSNDDGEENDPAKAQEAPVFISRIVRPSLLPSLRQGVVAKDALIRTEHMAGFGPLARHFPNQFPSFAAVFDVNAEQSFFFNIADAQHRCRMNALAMLRKAGDRLVVRDVLRVFIPYLVACVKDVAQGKVDSRQNTTEGKAKGFAESALLTISSLAKHLPWEGYLHVIRTMLRDATEYDSFRAVMLRGIVQVLEYFRFLDGAGPNRVASIVGTMERDVLGPLYNFIETKNKKANAKAKAADVGEATIMGHAGDHKVKERENRTIVQLPVAVAIVRIVMKFPGGCDEHIDRLLVEIVAKLRTKNDKHREGARKVLCTVMREVGLPKLGLIVTKLKDQLIHGYQLHVLGYTLVTLLDHMKDVFIAQSEERAAEAQAAGPSVQPRPTTLDIVAPKLMEIFVDDYLGEIGEQKDQVELKSTVMEVKRNRAVEGFVFLAKHCTAGPFMENFTERVKWTLAPPTKELVKNTSGSDHIVGSNAKYLLGDKKATADRRFVDKVRLMVTRVARGLEANPTLQMAAALESTRALLAKNNALRAEKIRQFEAKDGTRRIRGNNVLVEKEAKLSKQAHYEQNFAISQRPERIDVDFSSHTVLATQHKQKLTRYRGRNAKDMANASKSFAQEDPATAVVLDTTDEFFLRFLLSVLKRVLGIGHAKGAKDDTAAEDDVDADPKPADAKRPRDEEDVADEEAAVPVDPLLEATEAAEEAEERDEEDDDDDDDEEKSDDEGSDAENVGGEELDDFEVAAKREDEVAKEPKKQKGPTDAVSDFTTRHRDLLNSLLPVLLDQLNGEGSDECIATSLDNLQAIVTLRPPLPAVEQLSEQLFNSVVMFFERGGTIKQRSMRVVSAVVQHRHFKLTEDHARQLIKISRGEILERSDFLPMALAVTLAVVSKRIAIPEVYAIIQPITELMMHLATSKAIRARAVAVLVRFLTEYKMSMDKVRSHLDMYLRNLDYPEVTGRMALLELLQVLIFRLPTQVLRDEGPVMVVPLVTVLCQDSSPDAKERAAGVITALVLNAGVDVFRPTFEGWLSNQIRVRVTGLQTLAAVLPAIVRAYSADTEQLHEVLDWCFPGIVDGILYAQEHPSKKRREKADLSAKEVASVEMRHWECIFFGLRCLEALLDGDADGYFAMCAAEVIPALLGRLVKHTHTWIRQASMRIVQRYFYGYLEPRTGLLTGSVTVDDEVDASLPMAVAGSFAVSAKDLSSELSRLRPSIKRLLSTVEELDIREGNRFQLNGALEDPHRKNLLQVTTYLGRAISQSAAVQLARQSQKFRAEKATKKGSETTAARIVAQYAEGCAAHVSSVWTQLGGIVRPVLQLNNAAGYVVRCMTVIQLAGALVATLPPAGFSVEGCDEDICEAAAAAVAQACGVALNGSIVPLLGICTAYEDCDALTSCARNSVEVIKREVDDRSALFSHEIAGARKADEDGRPTKASRREGGSAAPAVEVSSASIATGLAQLGMELRRKRAAAHTREMYEKSLRGNNNSREADQERERPYHPSGWGSKKSTGKGAATKRPAAQGKPVRRK